MLRDWGQEKRYHHVLEGYNYRMDNLQGAFLRVKLAHLPAWTEMRRAHAAAYRELCAGSRVRFPREMPYAKHVYHLYAVMAQNRDALHRILGDKGIATGFHYPVPVHLQPCFEHLGYAKGSLPHTERAAAEEISLPMFPELTDAQNPRDRFGDPGSVPGLRHPPPSSRRGRSSATPGQERYRMLPMDAPGAPRPSSRPAPALRRAQAWILALALAAGARVATADTTKPVILIVVAPGADTGERAVQTIAAHLRLLGVEPQVVHEGGDAAAPAIVARSRKLASERGARGVLWVGAQPGELSIRLYERAEGRLYARSVAATKGQTAAAIESLALIARSASAKLLAGKVAAMPLVNNRGLRPAEPGSAPEPPVADTLKPTPDPVATDVVPSAAPPTAPAPLNIVATPIVLTPPDSADPQLVAEPAPRAKDAADPRPGDGSPGKAEVTVGYLGNSGTHSAVWRSAFAVEVGWRPLPSLTFALGYEVAPPDTAGSGDMGYSFQRHPIFLSTAYRFVFSDRWDLELGARGTANIVTRTGAMPGLSSPTVLGSVGPTIGPGVRILPFLRAGFLLGVDVALNPPPAMDPQMATDRLQILGGLGLQLELGPPARKAAQNGGSR